MQETSPVHSYLAKLFNCHVDAQWTMCRSNYINDYTTKAHDACGFRLDPLHTDAFHDRWLAVYRLLCQRTVCIPEVAPYFNKSAPMIRSCNIAVCYAPVAWKSDLKNSSSELLYDFYLGTEDLLPCSFPEYCRRYKIVKGELQPHFLSKNRPAIGIGVRFSAELKDNFIGQLASMHMPHRARDELQGCTGAAVDFAYVRCLLGFLNYLQTLVYRDDASVAIGTSGSYASADSFVVPLPQGIPWRPIFLYRLHALEYLEFVLFSDMHYRSMKHDRVKSAAHRLRASYYLATGVTAPDERE